jgi:hypothetical protein
MSTTRRTPQKPQTLKPRRSWRRVEVQMPVQLFERLEKWRRSIRVRPDDPGVLHEIDRTAAIAQLIESGISRNDQSLDSAATERLAADLASIHATFDAVGADLRRRVDCLVGLLDRLGPAAIAVPMIIAHWMAQDRDTRRVRETAEQAEDRLLDELEAMSAGIWAAKRREVLPSAEDLALPAGAPGEAGIDEDDDVPSPQGWA